MDGKSKDLTQEYIEQIMALFPEVVTEVADKEGCNIMEFLIKSACSSSVLYRLHL